MANNNSEDIIDHADNLLAAAHDKLGEAAHVLQDIDVHQHRGIVDLVLGFRLAELRDRLMELDLVLDGTGDNPDLTDDV